MTITKRINRTVLGMVLGSTMGLANASIVDLFGLPGNFDQGTFGASGTEFYAQSVTPDAPLWANLAFSVNEATGGSFNLKVTTSRPEALPGSATAPDATGILFAQGLVHAGGGAQIFSLPLNLAVTPGTVYYFVLDALGETLNGASVLATQFNGATDHYLGGEFIFSNDNAALSNTTSWTSRFDQNEDLVFRAEFVNGVVPEPLSIALVGLGLLGVAASRRQKPAHQ